jgi:hypothetical protein
LEVCAVLFREVGLVGGQISFRVDRVLSTDARAISAVDALIGIDVDLGDAPSGVISGLRRDGGGSAFGNADKILDLGIGYDVSHERKLLEVCAKRAMRCTEHSQPLGWHSVTRITPGTITFDNVDPSRLTEC